jgi:hypothetical protein
MSNLSEAAVTTTAAEIRTSGSSSDRQDDRQDTSDIKIIVKTAEDIIYDFCSVTDDVTKINLTKGSEYVYNSRNEKLHVRSYWPEGQATAIFIYLHGYASHGNRPTMSHLSSNFIEKNLAIVSLDFAGHGFSEGQRGLVNSPEALLGKL